MDDSKEVSSSYNRIDAYRTHRDRGSLSFSVCVWGGGAFICALSVFKTFMERVT